MTRLPRARARAVWCLLLALLAMLFLSKPVPAQAREVLGPDIEGWRYLLFAQTTTEPPRGYDTVATHPVTSEVSGGSSLPETISPVSGPLPVSAPRLSADLSQASQSALPASQCGSTATNPQPAKQPISARVPILMYHYVHPIDFSTSDHFTSDLTLPPAQFEQQLAYLKANGFTTIRLHDLALNLQGCQDLPTKPIVLSFDDGYVDSYNYVFPLLKKYGFQATFYIITGLVGKPGYLSWTQVKALSAGGMEIGSHTISHPDLAKTPQPRLDQELAGSKRTLEDALGVEVDALSYPSGSYNQTTIAAALKAGYTTAVTTKYGSLHRSDAMMELLRVRIHGTDTMPIFRGVIQQQTGR